MPDVFKPTTVEELAARLQQNAAGPKQKIVLVDRPVPTCHVNIAGNKPVIVDDSLPISLAGLNHVIDFPVRDMTITVEAGMNWSELQQVLSAEQQQLPIDVPDASATVGSVLLANLSGSRRYGYGTLRDYVIGISAVTSAGRCFKAGGRVVKNVAGYDLCKLMIGSRGTLAIPTSVTFKLKPIASESRRLICRFGDVTQVEPVLTRLLTSEARPVAIDLTPVSGNEGPRGVSLSLLVEGTGQDVEWQLVRLKEEIIAITPVACETSQTLDRTQSGIETRLTQTEGSAPAFPHGVLATLAVLPSKVIVTCSAITDLLTDRETWHAHAGDGRISILLAEPDRLPDLVRLCEQSLEGNLWSLVALGYEEGIGPARTTVMKSLDARLRKELDPEELLSGKGADSASRVRV